MYGLVNRAVEEMVRSRFDEATWERIKERAGLADTAGFAPLRTYPDAVTYALVGAASEELSTPAAALLEAFGEFWILETAERHYGQLMRICGNSLGDFLRNLDQMHTRISLTFPEMRPPSFEVTDETADGLHLHYRSERDGLAPFVIGLIRGLGKSFKTNIEITQLEGKAEGADHDVFRIVTRQ